ncbi:hypothetical protein [Seonamhaeicola sp.]|uniref:hypothetical protein n=1 Tax=Seonamhaeicola sp. TaxID=1912245 RepID=UPI0026329A5C|nr:hypothetical protein [Seonamhaeicola sp.]
MKTFKIPSLKNITGDKPTSDRNAKKSILARGCDPYLSLKASKAIPPLIGNPEYVPVTNDIDFLEKLKSRQWSVVYFAPGACRYSEAKLPIPGSNSSTLGWTLAEYKDLIMELQGNDVKMVETPYESESINFLARALETARETK